MTIDDATRAALDAEPLPAILLDRGYRILASNRAYELRYGELPPDPKCFAVSHGYASPCDQHGEDCPVRQTLASGRAERVLHVHHGPDGPEQCDIELRPIASPSGAVEHFMEVIRVVDGTLPAPTRRLIGRSPAFHLALNLLRRAAPAEVPVLLLGESGTGKELFARAVHEASPRADGPFVPLDCTGLPEALFESELFGHEKGAFTGATQRKKGLVEAARGGTLFLDEIGDVPLSQQVKLLRLLESRRYRTVGGVTEIGADFRLVCATHRDLSAMIAEERFREDLYYRISVFPLHLPPLRDRAGDVALLAETFLAELDPSRHLSDHALERLSAYAWPGNVRELRNVIQRALLLADDATVEAWHLPPHVRGEPVDRALPSPAAEVLAVRPLAEVERDYLTRVARDFQGSRRDLALALGLSERTLYRKLKSLLPDDTDAIRRPPESGGQT